MTVEHALRDFVSDPRPRAIALRGRWGTGKTYYWKRLIAPSITGAGDNYSYVSLFGIDSLNALKAATAVTATPIQGPSKNTRTQTLGLGEFWRGLRAVVRFVAREGGPLDTPYLNAPAAAMWLALRQLKGRIICFDDLERRGSDLALRDFLGFVTYLVEERSCRVVVIVNDDAMDGCRDWAEQREKVFQWDVRHEPSPDDAMTIGLSALDGSPYLDDAVRVLRIFGVTNIRLIARCARHAQQCIEAVSGEDLHPSSVKSIVSSSVLYAYSAHGQGSGAPTMAFLRTRGSIGREQTDDPEKAALHSSWNSKLNELEYYFKDETDEVLAQFAERGYLEAGELREAAHRYNQATMKHEAKQRFYGAWSLFHGSVGGSKDDVIHAFRETWPEASPHENAGNLESLARLLRDLGEPALATQFIQDWVAQRAEDGSTALDDREIHIFRKISDPELLAAIASARRTYASSPTLSAAFSELRNRNFSEEALSIIGSSSAHAVAEFWRQNDNKETIDTARGIISYTSSLPRHASAREVLLAAAKLLAADSDLAAIRIRSWFGV